MSIEEPTSDRPKPEDIQTSFPTNNFGSPNQFIDAARQAVFDEYNRRQGYVERVKPGGETYQTHLKLTEVYVVWFAKVLQNWKALVSTDVTDGRYYEVTYNGQTGETYVDTYGKISHTTVEDN